MLGAPVVLCFGGAGQLRGIYRTAVAGATTTGLLYGPFVASGHFAMFDFAWPVSSTSLVGRVFPEMTSFPWTLRLLQASIVLVGAGAVALLTRGSPYGAWLVPMAILTLRLTFDPLRYPYYYLAPALLAIVLAAWAVHQRACLPAVLTTTLAVWLWTDSSKTLAGTIVTTACVCVLGPMLLRRVGGSPATRAADPAPVRQGVPTTYGWTNAAV